MFVYLKQKFCSHKNTIQSYKFEDKFSITLPDGRLFTFVASFLTVTYKCERCGKVLRKEVVYENKKFR